MPPHKPMYRFPSRRSTVHSPAGLISCSQPLAAACGIRILNQGGNAADAAVAVAAALNLTEPCSTGIGGDMFCLFYDAAANKVCALNGSGRATGNDSLEEMRKRLGLKEGEDGRIPVTSVHAVTTPGAAAGWVDTVARFGSGNVSLAQILQPAIELAENGYPVSELTAYFWDRSAERIRTASPNGAELLIKDASVPNGLRAPRAGEIMTNKPLANTFRLLAERGKDGFYKGPVAEALLQVTASQGGKLSQEDLDLHAQTGTESTSPIKLHFSAFGANASRGGLHVWEHPPNGQGLVALLALGILQELDRAGTLPRWTPAHHNTLPVLHAVIEALRIAFADAYFFIADPATNPAPLATLLSPDYLRTRAALFDPHKAAPSLPHGSPARKASDTVYFATADRHGNSASFINSNYAGFGTAIVPRGCGFTLQNRGANFALVPGAANAFAPRKRPYHTIIPALATHADTGALALAFGVMGGFMQPQGHVQVLLNRYVFGLDVQEAVDAPRVCIGEGLPDGDGAVGGETVFVEEGIGEEVVAGLRALGHEVEVVGGHERALFGRGQMVERGEGVWSAGSDGRGDGAAVVQI